jgi:hypothetical protein
MKGVLIITLISMTLICVFWYTEIATPYQREFTHDKAKEIGGAILRTGSDASETALETGRDIYEGSGEVVKKAKELGHEALETGKRLHEKGEGMLEKHAPLFEDAKAMAGNLFRPSKDELPEF